jgi:hypothetical protein
MWQDESRFRCVPGGKEELLTAAAPALVADILRQYGQLQLRAHGCSMFPIIRSGDVLSIRYCTTEALQPLDVVLIADGDRLFAHRLIEMRLRHDEWFLITRGDSHWRSDPPRAAATLLGRVVAVTRSGRVLDAPFSSTLAERLYGLAATELTRLIRRARALFHFIPRPLLNAVTVESEND